MNKECRGCYLTRQYMYEEENFKWDDRVTQDKLTCVHDKLNCPCKTCLVKVTCDMIRDMRNCEPFNEFNINNPFNDYWKDQAKERQNANKIQSSKEKDKK